MTEGGVASDARLIQLARNDWTTDEEQRPDEELLARDLADRLEAANERERKFLRIAQEARDKWQASEAALTVAYARLARVEALATWLDSRASMKASDASTAKRIRDAVDGIGNS